MFYGPTLQGEPKRSVLARVTGSQPGETTKAEAYAYAEAAKAQAEAERARAETARMLAELELAKVKAEAAKAQAEAEALRIKTREAEVCASTWWRQRQTYAGVNAQSTHESPVL